MTELLCIFLAVYGVIGIFVGIFIMISIPKKPKYYELVLMCLFWPYLLVCYNDERKEK